MNILFWAALLFVPPAILALYFLKLRRQPIEVPSTFLWMRALEDLQVNSLWQRLRRNLLLFLQLLFALLLILACLPWNSILSSLNINLRTKSALDARIILLIDHSASMNAEDMGKPRLELAKQQAENLIEQMTPETVAMIISFSNEAQVVQGFTSDQSLLKSKLRSIKTSSRSTNVKEALQAAAGLANPGRTSEAGNVRDQQVAEALPATLYLFSDGGFDDLPDFGLGNLKPEYIPIGDQEDPKNVGIVKFSVTENPERPGKYSAFASLENFGFEDTSVNVSLYVEDELRDSFKNVKVPARKNKGLRMDLASLFRDGAQSTALRLEIESDDALAQDNVAFAALNRPRLALILLVSNGNEPLQLAMETSEFADRFVLETQTPNYLESEEYQNRATLGDFDLVIFDRCAPEEMPRSNTVFFGSSPVTEGWNVGPPKFPVQVIDTDQTHPLMNLIDMRGVLIVEASSLDGPGGTATLVESRDGAIVAIAPREGYEDLVIGFPLFVVNEEGELEANSDWPRVLSFPLFVYNLISYMTRTGQLETVESTEPGGQVELVSQLPVERLQVVLPSEQRVRVRRDARDRFVFHQTEDEGIYGVAEEGQDDDRYFSVNLFSPRESDLQVREKLEIGYVELEGKRQFESSPPKVWKWILLVGVFVLCLEWFIYNRRVFV